MNVKWEVNITRKYHIVSFAIVLKIPGTPDPRIFDAFAKKMINKNARSSDACASPSGSVPFGGIRWFQHTINERDTSICDHYRS